MQPKSNSRRNFIAKAALATAAISTTSLGSFAFPASNKPKGKATRIGWITDLHHGYMKDATQRLEAFLAEAAKHKLDFILQGGDFCHPTPDAKAFVQLWNQYKGER
jgi:hypothetical protein